MNSNLSKPLMTIKDGREKQAAIKYGKVLFWSVVLLTIIVLSIPVLNALYEFNPGNQ